METETIYMLTRMGIALVLGWSVLLAYHRCRVGYHRQRLFEIRDKLLDFAADGRIPFEHAAYGMLRSTINGFIRHAHRMTLTQMVLFFFACRKKHMMVLVDSFETRWNSAKRDLDEETSKQLDAYLHETHLAIGGYLVGPVLPLLLLLLASAAAANWCSTKVGRMKSRLKQMVDNLDRTALATGG